MSNRQMVIVGVILLGLFTLSQSFFIVDERERVILFQFGEVKGLDFEPGLHLKTPFVQNTRSVERRVMSLDSRSEEFLTSEKKNVKVNYYVKWKVAELRKFYRATGGQELVAADRLSSIMNRALRDQFSTRTIREAVSDERNAIMQTVQEETREPVQELGVEIVDVRVKAIDLPDEVSESVYQRMRAERQRVAADFRARGKEEAEEIRADADRKAEVILANAYKEAEEIRGRGDARAAEIYANAYSDDQEFYQFYRSLNIYRRAFSGSDSVMVLQPEGELFKYFNPKDER